MSGKGGVSLDYLDRYALDACELRSFTYEPGFYVASARVLALKGDEDIGASAELKADSKGRSHVHISNQASPHTVAVCLIDLIAANVACG